MLHRLHLLKGMQERMSNIGNKTVTPSQLPALMWEDQTIVGKLTMQDQRQTTTSVMNGTMNVLHLLAMTGHTWLETFLTARVILPHPLMIAALFLGMLATPRTRIIGAATIVRQTGMLRGARTSGFQTLDPTSVTEIFAHPHRLLLGRSDTPVLDRTHRTWTETTFLQDKGLLEYM